MPVNVQKNLKKATKWLKKLWNRYDLRKEIMDHPWRNVSAPYAEADKWMKNEIIPDKDHHYRERYLTQGKLYLFDYDDPKYKDTLPFYDTQPLTISLGTIQNDASVNDLGINLHLLPPRIRMEVMIAIFEMYKSKYKDQMLEDTGKIIPVKWSSIVKPLEKYGVGFCIRQYIPERKTGVIEFKYPEWKDAIFVRSKGYKKTSLAELQKLWGDFVHKSRNPRLHENWLKN